MWKIIKIFGASVSAVVFLMVENSPQSLRDSFCAWGVVDCPSWIDASWVAQIVQAGLLAILVIFVLSLLIPVVRRDFRSTQDFIGDTVDANLVASVKAPAPATYTLGHRFESASRSAELILRNTSTSEALENLDVTFANFSVSPAPYFPVNVRGQLRTNRGETFPITLNAGDQRYVRFAHLRAASTYRDVIDLENVSPKEFEGGECVVKFRISSKGIKAKNLYLHIKTNKDGEIEIYTYRRKKE